MNIVLIGMRGSGKSTISKLLAKRMNKQYIDLDKELEKKTSMPIRDVINAHGWDYFRDIESEIAENASKLDDTVISTGGGVVMRESNVKALKSNGKLIFLSTPIENLIRRISSNNKRPRLTTKESIAEEMSEVLKQREPIYIASADVVINTGNMSPTKTADSIIHELSKLNL